MGEVNENAPKEKRYKRKRKKSIGMQCPVENILCRFGRKKGYKFLDASIEAMQMRASSGL
jgi:hypothetical protein